MAPTYTKGAAQMSEHIRATIEELQDDVRKLQAKLIDTMKLTNMLCERIGLPEIYDVAELEPKASRSAVAVDEFFNKPLNTSVKTLLTRRKAAGRGPATAEDIYDGLIAGGYDKFPDNKDEALTGLRISLGKSSHTFVRLPNGSYGLGEWYDIKQQVKRQGAAFGKAEEKNGQNKIDTTEEVFLNEESPKPAQGASKTDDPF